MSLRVALIGCGGTIASTRDGASASAASVTADALMASIPPVSGASITEVHEFARINSWAITLGEMTDLARLVISMTGRPDVDAVIVTHGTDTIERSAFLTDLMYSGNKPVVFVGAMRPADDAHPDGPGNLARTLSAIGSGVLDGLGVSVCVGVDLHAARHATKLHSKHELAVVSPDFGPSAVQGADGAWSLRGLTLSRVAVPVAEGAVLPVAPVLAPQTDHVPGMIRHLLDATGAPACVVEGYGSGNVLPALALEIEAAMTDGAVVVLATLPPGDGVHPSYRGPGGGADLMAAGAHGSRTLNAGKASLLLSALLASGRHELGERFEAVLDVLLPLSK